MNKCIFILPYFGEFNNYFHLFLNSCKYNPNYDWLVITDSNQEFDYPANVHIKKMRFVDFRELVSLKFGFTPCLAKPYKLCDYKPMYGFLFEEEISDYKYWGHCDCDLIFGNLEALLSPILEKGFDKLFAAGHLTIYKNTPSNNRVFMRPVHGRFFYKEALACEGIYVFDEDFPRNGSGDRCNVHSIFLNSNCSIYQKDLSFNVSTTSDHLRRIAYDAQSRLFKMEPDQYLRLYWTDGSLCSFSLDLKGNLVRNDYLYVHLQSRPMCVPKDLANPTLIHRFEILPDRFKAVNILPTNASALHFWQLRFPSSYWFHVYRMKFRRKALMMINHFKSFTPPTSVCREIVRGLLLKEKSSSASYVSYLRKRGASIGSGTNFYDPRSTCFGLNEFFTLTIGNNVSITHGVVIADHGYDWSVIKGAYGDVLGSTAPVSIGNNVFIGMNATILKGVSIGDNVIIGAGSIVTHDIPSNSVAAGNPCRVIYPLSEYRSKRAKIQLDEAFNLYISYSDAHNGAEPHRKVFREYHWLFERPDLNGHFSCVEFDEVNHLVNGSNSLSVTALLKCPPRFCGYQDFLNYCRHRRSQE